MRKTAVFTSFTEAEQQIIRKALRKPAKERRGKERELLRRFWAAHKQRSRSRLPALDDHRFNREYRNWLRKNKLPDEFDRTTYARFRREHGLS